MDRRGRFEKYGLYDPRFEHDSCGVGFVCDVKGRKSNAIIRQGLEVLKRLSHRGATGADAKTGDGAGILIQMPHDFLLSACAKEKIRLPAAGDYGAGLVFLPVDEKERNFCKRLFSKIIKDQGQVLLGWRKVPVDDSGIGITARRTKPVIEQVFVGKKLIAHSSKLIGKDGLEFERKLYIIRRKIENIVRDSKLRQKSFFYITNLSNRTLSYKGLLMPGQVKSFFPDLTDERTKSALILVHSRYSTNTFPAWDLAQPFRYLAHNGEINTLQGNINWMRSRERLLKSEILGRDLKKALPVIVPGGSDSASLDNLFELLVLSGRSLAEAAMMLIPEAWQGKNELSRGVRDFYRYHACLMEPWDGPAAIAFTDGTRVAAVLDRNGLRPCRYIVTKDGLVVMASEAGVLDIAWEDIRISGRLEPGKIFFINTELGRIMSDSELKERVAKKHPYGKWLKGNLVEFGQLRGMKEERRGTKGDIFRLLKAFGYTREDMKMIIKPMALNAVEPVGSMGNDTPHAILSKEPQLLYNYFKQLFAQVTNPPIDPIREELVMSLDTYLGPENNLLDEAAEHCRKLRVENPILSDAELSVVRKIRCNGFKSKDISLLFKVSPEENFKRALDKLCKEAAQAVKSGYSFIILSDRGVDKEHAALPMLLAVSAVHHFLLKRGLRSKISIIAEAADCREVHHFALLFGYGADCINPYLAYQAVDLSSGESCARENYRKALTKGILKILSKMGISTLQSYRGAQIFEALGLGVEVISRYFSGTPSRIGGAGLGNIAAESLAMHSRAFSALSAQEEYLGAGGLYQWKRGAETHLWNPESIAALQDAVRSNDYEQYKKFAFLINDQSANPVTLRSLLKFKNTAPVPLKEVEPMSEIVRRFATGAMSFGSISRSAHETIAIAMNRLKARSNSGEGGEDPARFTPLADGDSLRSAVKQVASGRFGVNTNYLVNADELQIKIAQGAKPGEGGQLPGHKVSVTIARTRYTTAGVILISPPPHHDIYSIEDLAQLIFDLKNTNPQARISVKLVSEIGVGTVAAGVAKGHADMILISGGDGGTGASPLSSIRHAGLPWELGLSETHQTLVMNDLRSRVRLQTDGQLRTGRDVAIAALLGAEEFGFATVALIVLGCVMLRHCHLNNCLLGVATQDEALEKRFTGKPEYLENYFNFVAMELREVMAALGVRKLQELVGRSELLEMNRKLLKGKTKGLDFSRILYKPRLPSCVVTHCSFKQEHGIDRVLDKKLIFLAKDALENQQPVKKELLISNTDRASATMLSGLVCKLYGEQGLAEGMLQYKFKGVAGQSFGAWLAKGITLELEGMANDYVGKGISGGRVIIYPDRKTDYAAEKNIIIGNTAFYGAISGEAYIRGKAGERFCIRNSGLSAVVEGLGDHGCEYMTGGRVVVLGETGRNFAAGMSGGLAYVYDEGTFRGRCNTDMVQLEELAADDLKTLRLLLDNHYRYTRSAIAKMVLDDFPGQARKFVRVVPLEYKRILQENGVRKKLDLAEVSDG